MNSNSQINFCYKKEIQSVIDNKIIEKELIFDYRNTPLEKLCESLFQFSKELIERNIENFKIKPCYIIFTNNYSSNAKAVFYKNTFSIHINMGLINYCKVNFLDNNKINNYFKEKVPSFQKYINSSVSELNYLISTYFTIYHEIAHLIQFEKKRLDISLQERHEVESNYEEEKHYLEINADTFASDCITRHILQYVEQISPKNISLDDKLNAMNLIVIVCTGLLNYIASFSDKLPKIYYKEFKHPHPFVRLFIVLVNLFNNVNGSYFIKENNIKVNVYNLFDRVINIYIDLEKENVFNTSFKETLEVASNQRMEILKYMFEMIEFDKITDYNNAIEISK